MESLPRALAQIAAYAIAASTSFGRAFYQPQFDKQGDELSEPDPATGAVVTAKLDAVAPHYLISYSVSMPDGATFDGHEEITGTKIGLRGLGMPAPSVFEFQFQEYSAKLTGIITSELALSLFARTRIRGYGLLSLNDNAGNSGVARVERSGALSIEVNGLNMTPENQIASSEA